MLQPRKMETAPFLLACGGMEACSGTHYIARQLAAAADMEPDAV